MISDQIVSISDLKMQPSKYIGLLQEQGDKYILVHNKPKAVLVDINKYEKILKVIKSNNIGITDDYNIVGSINDVFGWREKEIIFG